MYLSNGLTHRRSSSVVAHLDLDWNNAGLSPGHTNNFENCAYCSSTCAGHTELELRECLGHKKNAAHTLYNGPPDKGGII